MTENALWTGRELADVWKVEIDDNLACYGVSIDSRTVEDGDLFFALVGPNSDGHDYVKMSLEKGAAAAVVTHILEDVDPDRQIVVPDAFDALVKLGRAARARVDIPIIAVTGSAGKTGTKEALRLALSRDKKTHASILSYNNEIGVPLSLARMPRDAAYGIFEMGMNHKGELAKLVKLVRPHVAIITTVELAHGEFFENVEEIADAKAEILTCMEGEGVAILNHDNDHYARLEQRAREAGVGRVISFGSDPAADVHILRQVMHDTCSCVVADLCGKVMVYKVGMLGQHWIMNSLAVLAAVAQVGGDLGLAGLALAEMTPLKGRGKRHRIFFRDGSEASFLLIDESYNANPASMRAALAGQSQVRLNHRGRRIAVLGDMAELGEDTVQLHAGLADALTEAEIDRVYLVGENMKHLADNMNEQIYCAWFKSLDDLEPALLGDLQDNDVVMVKGSNSSGMFRLVDRMLEMVSPNIKKAVSA
ncbi:UDP-N-acetylmuramoylalanyl-D-glutamyl-2,6-diaminopimelate--D-alanyl-D-alanine ligase [Emcibacter sp.]|uniref:UDP-N-acetylmuramoylalanyl-D-glutamyl-2, 6-diaminopimelate--D-alanyl-D-alanine ligase n=1 Tax=Emcibacter sp. TaxID=1979954 RepID=UPI002AA76E80|nr:UDP-N-acetylmuramoylalanyl-D-glutamyl-2,6-diaminopimelate--D-alanyl-D-alanine ligase [Emcibacter sp.]